jgi:hypothetical protein
MMSIQQLPATARRFMNSYIVDVSPDLARKWLNLARFNRDINYAVVSQYVRQINEGLWRRTHQGVALTKTGVLIDGQHRLLAIIKAGQTVPMIVFVDEPEENFEFIDCGRNRSHLDMMRLSQRNNALSSLHTSTVKAFLAGRFCSTTNWSAAEINREYDQYSLPINFIVALFQSEKDKKVNDPTVRGFLARAYYSVSHDRIIEFVNRLFHNNGDNSDPVSHYVRCLHIWDDRQKNTRCEIYKRGVQTFLAFLQDRNDPGNIDVSYDVFPIPKGMVSRTTED